MTLTILFSAPDASWPAYRTALPAALAEAGVPHHLTREAAPEEVDYIVYAPGGPIEDFGPYTNTRAVLSLWAGVETIVTNTTLTQPLCRMVDSGLRQGMVEWVTGHVLRHHLGMDTHIHGQDGLWREDVVPPLASDRPVGILGLGALGAACGAALAGLGFPVRGWSRRPRELADIETRSGQKGLEAVLRHSQILVLLLPLTPDTRHILNSSSLAQLPRGAVVINPGRGPLIADDALLRALDEGQIGHATLDVFETEPLPPEHPYWAHPRVTVTPHIASATRPSTASAAIARNIAGHEAGEPLRHLVDRTAGY